MGPAFNGGPVLSSARKGVFSAFVTLQSASASAWGLEPRLDRAPIHLPGSSALAWHRSGPRQIYGEIVDSWEVIPKTQDPERQWASKGLLHDRVSCLEPAVPLATLLGCLLPTAMAAARSGPLPAPHRPLTLAL